MSQIKMLKGALANLNNVSIKDGQFLITVDEGKIYLDNGSTRIQLYKKDLDAILSNIGILTDLTTTEKTNLVKAINEVRAAVEAGETGSQVTIDTTTTTEGAAKSYTIKQGETTIGIIDIPKDMVISSAEVVKNPEDQDPGTYIEITIANATKDKIYINVKDLIDIYTAAAGATQVQLAVSATNEISATIVAGSITSTELASDAVETTKIKDANVTTAKLADEAVTQEKIANDAVGADQLANDAVDTAALLDSSVTLAKLNNDVKDRLAAVEWGDFPTTPAE